MPTYVDKVIKVTNKNSKHYGKIGLVGLERPSQLFIISFIKKTKEDCHDNEIIIKARPFKVFMVLKKSVAIVPDSTVAKHLLKRARGSAKHMMLRFRSPHPYTISYGVIHRCKRKDT